MLIPRFIVAPLVGGVIGYITNDLAIRMLFRPRKAVFIGRFHVPFTPGLIPAQQGRIASRRSGRRRGRRCAYSPGTSAASATCSGPPPYASGST